MSEADEMTQARRARLLFGVAIAGIVLYVVLDAVVQSLPPYYSPISQAESYLAVGPYGYIMTLNFILRGVLSLCFLFGLALTANSMDTPGPTFRRGGYLFAAWSVGALLLAAFPADVPPAPVSLHGAVHLAVAVTAFLCGSAGAMFISLGMARNKGIGGAKGAAVPLAALTVVLFIVEIASPIAPGFSSGYGGLLERLFLGSVLLWVGVVSGILIARPSHVKALQAGELEPRATSQISPLGERMRGTT